MTDIGKVLITGASGFLGWNLCRLGVGQLEILGTVCMHPIDIPKVKTVSIDLTNYRDIKKLLQEIRPEAIIHTAAISDVNYCQENPSETSKINRDSAINISGLCADLGIGFIFTSTDLVFDGLNPPYDETSPVSPISRYAEQKVEAEIKIQECNPNAAICRMPLMYGDSGPIASSFIQPMIKALEEEKEINLFTDEFRTPLSGRDAATGLLWVLENGFSGLFHLGGPERISRYDFGKLLAEVMNFKSPKLVACKTSEVKLSAPRPKDTSFNSSKAVNLGFKPGMIHEELENLRKPLNL